MFRFIIAALIVLAASNAEARQRHKTYLAHPDCNILWSCQDVAPSPRGERIAKKVGFGAAQKVYTPRADANLQRKIDGSKTAKTYSIAAPRVRQRVAAAIIAHPLGCPSRAFCGCGAAVRVFGAPVRSLWLAANWFKFPRTSPAPGTVAVRRHHVFVLEAHLGGDVWQVYDANSGGRLTRIHARSIAGYVIVNPHASRYASAI